MQSGSISALCIVAVGNFAYWILNQEVRALWLCTREFSGDRDAVAHQQTPGKISRKNSSSVLCDLPQWLLRMFGGLKEHLHIVYCHFLIGRERLYICNQYQIWTDRYHLMWLCLEIHLEADLSSVGRWNKIQRGYLGISYLLKIQGSLNCSTL